MLKNETDHMEEKKKKKNNSPPDLVFEKVTDKLSFIKSEIIVISLLFRDSLRKIYIYYKSCNYLKREVITKNMYYCTFLQYHCS